MCCTRLAANAGPKKVAKNRHLGTTAQLCRVISSQIRHASTIGKKNLLSSNISSTCPHNMVNFGPLEAEIVSFVWGTLASWQRYCTAFQQWASAKLSGVEQRAPPIFGRAAITLGIGPHSSLVQPLCRNFLKMRVLNLGKNGLKMPSRTFLDSFQG